MFGLGWGTVIKGAIVIALVAGVGIAVWRHFNHIDDLERTVVAQAESIATHEANEAQYKATIESKERQIDNLRSAMESVQKHREEADRKFAEAREKAEYVKRIFDDHDFAKLARLKPGLISKRMQRGTDNVFTEVEQVGNSF